MKLDRHSYLKSYTDSVMGNWSYSYDNLNRLIGGSAASGPYSASPPSSWSYDPFGNRTSGVTPVSSAYASYALPNNQITGGLVQYDAAGNVISDTSTGNSYLYDGEGRNSTPRMKTYPFTPVSNDRSLGTPSPWGPRFCAVLNAALPSMSTEIP
jgi:hypothetical protein